MVSFKGVITMNLDIQTPRSEVAVPSRSENIKKIVQKMVVTYRDWQEMLPFALHGYYTSVRTSTGAKLHHLSNRNIDKSWTGYRVSKV